MRGTLQSDLHRPPVQQLRTRCRGSRRAAVPDRVCRLCARCRYFEWPEARALELRASVKVRRRSTPSLPRCGEDPRIKEAKVAQHVNLLFWAIIGAAEQLLRFEEGDDWSKDWRSALDRGGLLAGVATDLALGGAAKGMERDEMIGCLARLRASVSGVRENHFDLISMVLEDFDELVGLAADAGRLSTVLEEAVAKLQACRALESAVG